MLSLFAVRRCTLSAALAALVVSQGCAVGGTRPAGWTGGDFTRTGSTAAFRDLTTAVNVGPNPTPLPGADPVFGMNDGSGYNTDLAFNRMASATLKRLGLKAARMGSDNMGCRKVGEPCTFARRDAAVDAHLAEGIAIHMTTSWRGLVSSEGGLEQWTKNYGYFCGQMAKHYKGKIHYYINGNEPDLSYGSGDMAANTPEVVVKMQKVCYEAIKAVDTRILVESSPAQSPETPYNRELFRAGIAKYADIIGTHMYGTQVDRDAVGTLRRYMAEFGIDKPVAISEAGYNPDWEGGTAKRAAWLKQVAQYAKDKKLHNVLFFSMYSVHGSWEMDKDPLAMDALDDIGHGRP